MADTAPPPPPPWIRRIIFAKYFKKSPKLAKIYPKNLGRQKILHRKVNGLFWQCWHCVILQCPILTSTAYIIGRSMRPKSNTQQVKYKRIVIDPSFSTYQVRQQVNVYITANTRGWPNVVLMLGRRRRRRANIKTALGQPLVFARIV